MNLFLILAFLFCTGSLSGWVLELFYRRFFSSANPGRRWINPGFCTGPYLPLYGSGLCILYLIASLKDIFPSLTGPVIFILMAVSMTVIEYISGLWCLKRNKIRLWDYSDEWGNIQGLICPRFSLYWAILGAVYYFLIHPRILTALSWLAKNLAFSFVIGMFFGVFAVDFAHSAHFASKLKAIAEEYEIVVHYEELKSHIRAHREEAKQKYRFFLPFRTELPLREHLKAMAGRIRHN